MLSRIFTSWMQRHDARHQKLPQDESEAEDIELESVAENEKGNGRSGHRKLVPKLALFSPLQSWLTRDIAKFKAADTINEEDVPAVAVDMQSLRDMLQLLLDGRVMRFLGHPLIGGRLVLGFMLEFVSLCCALSSPVILRYLLKEPRLWLVMLWTVANTAGTCSGRIKDQVCRLHASTISAGLKSTLLAKAQRLSGHAKLRYPPATIINMSSRDVSFVTNYVLKVHDMWSAALQLGVIFVLLLSLLGAAAIWSYVFMIILFFTQSKANLLAGASVKGYSESNDKRLGLLREYLNGVKGMKLLGIESMFAGRVQKARAVQQTFIQTYLRLTFSLFTTMNQMIPGLTAAVGILAYCWSGHELRVDVVFPALALFEMTYGPATKLSLSVTRQFSVLPCLRRISGLLTADEELLCEDKGRDTVKDVAVEIQDATLGHPQLDELEQSFSLHINQLDLPQRSLTVVTGPVGSGKSTLLWSLAGVLPAKSYKGVYVQGPVFLAPQEPWIFSGTLRDNIVFKSDFDRDWYTRVVQMCCLEPDLAALPKGSDTMLGAGGANISGGQRARVCLARAVYSQSPVLLLDDPLAAVDPHVARHIIKECLLKLPQTVVLATHSTVMIGRAQLVVLLDSGRVVDSGTPAQLENRLHLNSKADTWLDQNVNEQVPAAVVGAAENGGSAAEALIQDEERATGTVHMSVLKFYAKHVGGRRFMMMAGSIFVTSLWTRCLVGFWFVWWVQDKWHWPLDGYLGGYLGLTILQAASLGMLGVLLVSGSLRASSNIHEQVVGKLFAASLRFFEAQPAGRIINRLSADMQSVDTNLMNAVDGFFVAVGQMLASMLVIIWTAPPVLVLVPVTGFVAWRIQSLYRVSARELRRLSSLLSSRVVAALDETIQGLGIIRALRAEALFLQRHSAALLKSADATMVKDCLDTWVTVRAEAMSIAIVTCCGLLYVSGFLASAQAGLALSTAISLTKNVYLLLWAIVQIELEMNSVERLKHYIEEMPCEAQFPARGPPLPQAWPTAGEIRFDAATVRYKTRARPALSELSLVVQPRQRVAIVGRTGSGKSSLVAALSRLVELDSGQILIDGVDITTLDLSVLRRAVHTLPQEPLIFAGTLRQNLDPQEVHSDEELWRALEACGLRQRFEQVLSHENTANSLGLDVVLDAGGANCSSGELQLVCMARAMLQDLRILILDEATAALDTASSVTIDQLLKTHFKNSTVLCIMHRVSSALSMDQVVVVDDGKVVEIGDPHALLQQQSSRFAMMIQAGS